MEEMIQQVWARFLRVLEVVDNAVDSGSYRVLEDRLSCELNELGRFIIQQVMEAVDERLRENLQERRGWVVERRNDVKEVLSPFGPIRYHRTYFRNRSNGQYAYLADEWMGLTPHARIAPTVKAALVESSAERSYRRSGRWTRHAAWHVSGQTVMNALRENSNWEAAWSRPDEKRQVEYLYVEADEDHVPNRRYLDAHYDLECVKTIFVSGDGASWIRQLVESIPGAVFVLDRFHAVKKMTAAVGRWEDLSKSLRQAVEQADREKARSILKEAHKRADTEHKRKSIEKTLTYLMRQWDGIKAWSQYRRAIVGCSAEGHVSHIYAARMSSRPMAWTKSGVDRMARLRVLQANQANIREQYLRGREEQKRRPSDRWRKQLQASIKQGSQLGYVIHANIPAFSGPRSMFTRALRGLANAV